MQGEIRFLALDVFRFDSVNHLSKTLYLFSDYTEYPTDGAK